MKAAFGQPSMYLACVVSVAWRWDTADPQRMCAVRLCMCVCVILVVELV